MKMPRDYPDGQTVSLLYLDFAIFRFSLYLDFFVPQEENIRAVPPTFLTHSNALASP